MTYLQQLITEGVSRGFTASLEITMETAGTDFVQALRADPEFRQHGRMFVRAHIERLVEEMAHASPHAHSPSVRRTPCPIAMN
jgi:hypothetical protein